MLIKMISVNKKDITYYVRSWHGRKGNKDIPGKIVVELLKCDYAKCGKEFINQHGPLRRGKPVADQREHFCSSEHFQISRRLPNRFCINCGKEFRIFKSEANRWRLGIKRDRKYCSTLCYRTHIVGVCLEEGCDEQITAKMVGSRTSTERPQMFPEYCTKHKLKLFMKADRQRLLDDMGNKCVCCGERDYRYLQFDHVENDGKKHRQKDNAGSALKPKHLRDYLEKNPGGLQILCANCNCAKNNNGGELYVPDKFTRRKAA